MEYNKNTVFVTGIAKPVKDDPVTSIYEVFFVSLIIDKSNDLIINAACNTASPMTEDFIRSLVIGRNILTEMEAMTQEIRCRFFGLLQKALIVALKDAHNRYMIVTKTNQLPG
ncbi:MAG: hypothetical protein K0Q77_1154 [Anaerosporomusa subterranea]|nr:hypothetical protein [Anaerosporomusa subterranea]